MSTVNKFYGRQPDFVDPYNVAASPVNQRLLYNDYPTFGTRRVLVVGKSLVRLEHVG